MSSVSIYQLCGLKSHIKLRIKLVFQLPECQIIKTKSQGLISRDIQSKTFLFQKLKVRFFIFIK